MTKKLVCILILISLVIGCRKEYKLPVIVYKDDISLPVKLVVSKNHREKIIALAYSPDGKYVASSGEDKKTKIWDVKSEKLMKEFNLSSKELAFTSDGQILKIGLSFFNIVTGKLWKKIDAGKRYVSAMDARGENVVIGEKKDIRVVNLRSGKVTLWLKNVPSEDSWVYKVAISRDGKYIAAYCYQIKLWNVKTGKLIKKIPPNQASGSTIYFSYDGKYLVNNGYNLHYDMYMAAVYDTETGKVVKSAKSIDMAFQYLSRDKRTIIGLGKKSIKFYDINKGKVIKEVKLKEVSKDIIKYDYKCMAVSPDEKTVLLNFSWDFFEYNIRKMRFSRKFIIDRIHVNILDISKDGQYVALGGRAGGLVLLNRLTGRVLWSKENDTLYIGYHVEISQDNKYVGILTNQAIKVYNLKSGKLAFKNTFKKSEASDWGTIFAFSQDSKYLALVVRSDYDSYSYINIFSTKDFKVINKFKNIQGITKMVFKSDNATLVTYGQHYDIYDSSKTDVSTKLWDFKTGRLKAKLEYLIVSDPYFFKKDIEVGNKYFNGHEYEFCSQNNIFMAPYDGNLYIRHMKTGKELIMTIYPDGEWVIRDNKGHFDYSKGAGKHISYVRGMKSIPLNAYRHKNYKPGLFKRALRGE